MGNLKTRYCAEVGDIVYAAAYESLDLAMGCLVGEVVLILLDTCSGFLGFVSFLALFASC